MNVIAETEVAIVGAGPYGLSLAAHLKAQGVEFRIFGVPMELWRTKMPKGMRLKSEGFASNLYDPDESFTLGKFCAQHGIPYEDIGLPVALQTFCDYGLAFQKRFAPDLDERMVDAIELSPNGYILRLEDGETIRARKVVCAVGISHFHYTPPILGGLPPELVSHSSRHHALDGFKGREVAVVGAGASALDLAALLHQAGAAVQVVTRRPSIPFHHKMRLPRTFIDKLRAPMSGLGPGWRSRLCTDAPLLFHVMPQWFRLEVVLKHLGPAPGWFVREQIEGKVPIITNAELASAEAVKDRVRLQLRLRDGTNRDLVTEHVVAATGYRVDLGRLSFLTPSLRARLREVENTPVLSSHFEASVPGLYFVGVAAANNFGPMLRFAYGAGFTARRLSRHLARSAPRRASSRAFTREPEAGPALASGRRT